MSELRHVLIGAHLQRADLAGVDGIESFAAGALFVSALGYPEGEGIASRDLIGRVTGARQALIEKEVFVAIRYGVSVSSPAQVEEKCRDRVERWEALLRETRGCVELTLKVPTSTIRRPDRKQFESGKDYLHELKRLRSTRPDPAFVERVDRLLTVLAKRSRWIDREDGSCELALLIERGRLDQAREGGVLLQKEFSSQPFLLSGPWPLEVFANEP